MSTVKTNNVQVGQSGTATNNFTVYQPSTPDGTVRIGVGNSGATTLDVVTVSNAGNMTVTGTVTAAAVTSTSTPIPIASGGTGQVTQQAAINALTGTQTANRVLRSDGTNATLSQVALTTDVTGTLPVANGGTGAATLTANNVILGNGTSAVGFVAPGSNGNILTSNGTTWTSAAAASSYAGPSSQLFTSNGTFTVPAGITQVRITVVGGGGGGGGCSNNPCDATEGGIGGFGGSSIAYVTGLTPGGTISITVGAAGTAGGSGGGAGGTGGTSSAASYASATGGTGGNYNQTGGSSTPGVGSLGRFNASGSPNYGYANRRTTNGNGIAGTGYGSGGGNGWSNNNGNKSGGAGGGGMVQVEW